MSKTDDTMSSNEEHWYVVPELEVKIPQSWINLIQYCQDNLPFGDLRVEISNSQPGKRLKETPSIRFDKQSTQVKDGVYYLIQSLDIRVSEYWVNLIQWCQSYFVKGVIEFRLVSGQPTELLYVNQNMNFSKPETIPPGIPLSFSRT